MGFDWLSLKNYKRHYICLDCQKGFKRPSKEDMKHSKSVDLSGLMEKFYSNENNLDIVEYINQAYQKLKVVCPNCQGQMLQVHYNFEVPPQRNDNAWKKLRKELHPKMTIQYDSYIHWHRLELNQAAKNSVRFKKLKENLSILERMTR